VLARPETLSARCSRPKTPHRASRNRRAGARTAPGAEASDSGNPPRPGPETVPRPPCTASGDDDPPERGGRTVTSELARCAGRHATRSSTRRRPTSESENHSRPACPEASRMARRKRRSTHVAKLCSELPNPVFRERQAETRARELIDGHVPPKSAVATSLTRPAPVSPDDALAGRSQPPRHRSPSAEANAECVSTVLPVPPKRPRAPGVAAPRRVTRHTEVRQEPERCRRTADDRGRRCRSRACRSSHRVELPPASSSARCRATPSAGGFPEHPPSRRCSVDESVSRPRRCQRCRDLSFHGLCSPPRSAHLRLGPGLPGDTIRWSRLGAEAPTSSRRPEGRQVVPMGGVAGLPMRSAPEGTSRAGAFRRPPWGL
jgi:hypothetical protein